MSPSSAQASAGSCSNELLRAEQGDRGLPDCRAYELVTPSEKAGTQDLAFVSDAAAVSPSGERVALKSNAFFGSDPSPRGTRAVLSRTGSGWDMTSIQPPGAGETAYEFDIANPDLTLLGLQSSVVPTQPTRSPLQGFWVGAVGGPYVNVANTAFDEGFDALAGASSDFAHVVLSSSDHSLSPVAAGTVEGAHDLYEWSAETGELTLVNVTTAGALTSECGASLGRGIQRVEGFAGAPDAVSADGSAVVFTSPDREAKSFESSCEEASRIYLRAHGETIEVSAPAPGVSDPSGPHSAFYEGATEDDSKIWFTSEAELTADDGGHAMELYEYDVPTHALTRISRGELENVEAGVSSQQEGLATSKDGSMVYFLATGRLTADTPEPTSAGASNVYLYEAATGRTTYIASAETDNNSRVPLETDGGGDTLIFQAGEVTGPDGFTSHEGYDEVFRYNVVEKALTCVSCPPAGREADGGGFFTGFGGVSLGLENGVDRPRSLSEDGRFVFFNSNDELTSQDSNGSGGSNVERATDVYEWESDGTGSCTDAAGCQSLLSSGTSEYAAVFLGSGADGRDVFIGTHSALAPQDGDVMGDIYDARIGGGFASQPPAAVCGGEDCRLIGAAAPVFGVPQSFAFVGAGNPRPIPPAKALVKKRKRKHAHRRPKRPHKRKHRRRNGAHGSGAHSSRAPVSGAHGSGVHGSGAPIGGAHGSGAHGSGANTRKGGGR